MIIPQSHSRKRIPLVGQIFSQLKVINCHPDEKDHIFCLCSCGVEKFIPRKNLFSGKTKSCGCLQQKAARDSENKVSGAESGNFVDLTGKKVGMITYIHIDQTKPPREGVWWVGRCDCGNLISRLARRRGSQSCGCLIKIKASQTSSKRLRKKHPAWKGGRLFKDGYVMVLMPDHPRAKSVGYVFEHILVMEKHVGRPILPSETIHHKNGDRADNRIDNLELWDGSHPPGQRSEDKMRFYADELLLKASP